MDEKRNLVAPCGIDCFNCEFYQDNITEKWQQMLATRLNLAPALVGCKGCREQPGCLTFPRFARHSVKRYNKETRS